MRDKYLEQLMSGFEAGVKAARPEQCLPKFLPEKPKGRTFVIGAGKASAMMAKVLEDYWEGDLSGVVITRYGHKVATRAIEVIEASHPVPDHACVQGSEKLLKFLEQTKPDDLVIALISGGGSSLLSLPVHGVTLTDMQSVTSQLLKCGASITEINTVRKHLTRTLGGKIAEAAAPATLVTLAISDVAGDDPTVIASGATVPDPSTLADARAVIAEYGISISNEVRAALENPVNETPKINHPAFARATYHMIAAPQMSMQAAAETFEARGIKAHILSSEIEGDTNQAAEFHAALVKQIARHNQPFQRPCVIISGGETTVKIAGTGEGGPNTQFMLALALKLNGYPGIYAAACDTDGIDGVKDNAGALITPETIEKARKLGLNAHGHLANNDSYGFFKALNDLIITGPTHTNVNDLRMILIA